MRKPCPICFREVSWNYFALIGHAKSHATTIRGLYEKDTAANGSANRDELYKIGLPVKLILSKRKGLPEVLFS